MPKKTVQPAYRRHNARDCAVVTLNGKNHYLGPWQSPESHQKYAVLIADWQRNRNPLPAAHSATASAGPALTVGEVILAYFRFAQTRYVKHGKPTSEISCIRMALRPVRALYAETSAAEFVPRALKNVRQRMIDAGRARTAINKDVHRVKRMVRWAVEEELLPADAYHRLQCVRGLGKGQSAARETARVAPVPVAHVEAVLPHLPPPVAAMVRLQLLIGSRPQEVADIRPMDVEQAGDGVWYYRPATHKTEHHGRDKVIVLGPQAQAVLRPWLDRDPAAYCFRPAESAAWSRARRRKSAGPKTTAESARLNPKYNRYSYRLAVSRACRRAGVPAWSPRQLRHTRATQIRAAYGSLEAAKAVLGHTDTRVTEIYADRDIGLAARVMQEIG